jgi:hypothetical protein
MAEPSASSPDGLLFRIAYGPDPWLAITCDALVDMTTRVRQRMRVTRTAYNSARQRSEKEYHPNCPFR